MTQSISLTFRLGQKGDQAVEVITQRGGGVQVKAKPGDDGIVVVEIELVPVGEDRGQPVDGEGQGNNAVPNSAEYGAGIRDRHVVRVGDAGHGCVRVLSHEVSPYNWRLVNFGASQQAYDGLNLVNQNLLSQQWEVEPRPSENRGGHS